MANPVFKDNYARYLEQLKEIDLEAIQWNAGITVENGAVVVPFFNQAYRVSDLGIFDSDGNQPSYAALIVLLKYLLMCPQQMPVGGTDWIPYREFKDSGQSQGTGLSDYVAQTLANRFTGKLD